jgi:hypothetical protein
MRLGTQSANVPVAKGGEQPIAHKEQNPTYNERYGFVDGAQQDAVIGKDGSPVSPVPTPGSSSGAARSAPPACLSASLSVTAAALALSAMSAMSSLQLYLL